MRTANFYGTKEMFMEAIKDMVQCQAPGDDHMFAARDGMTFIELISEDHGVYVWNVKHVHIGKSKIGAGYYMIHTRRGNRLAHRLVASAYLLDSTNYNDPFEVNHIDGNKDNNSVYNLELCTHQENMKKAREMGLIANPTEHPRYFRKIETLIFPDHTRMKMSPAEYVAWRIDRKMPIKGWMTKYMFVKYGIDQF